MASSCNDIPYEVLDRIIRHFDGHSKDLCQLRLVSRRWHLIAEKLLYNRLQIQCKYKASACRLILAPLRSRLVRTLDIKGTPMNWHEKFFEEFPSINKITINLKSINDGYLSDTNEENEEQDGVPEVDWKYIYDTFTPDRCALKHLECQGIPTNKSFYADMMKAHCQTLEEWSVSEWRPSKTDSSSVTGAINSVDSFPKLKRLRCKGELYNNLVILDNTISKCPMLEDLGVMVFSLRKRDRLIVPSYAVVPHQQTMKGGVTIWYKGHSLAPICKYFTTKFPNAEKWIFGGLIYDLSNQTEAEISRFEDLRDSFQVLAKSNSVMMKFNTYYTLVSEILEPFCASGQTAWSINIDYHYTGEIGRSLKKAAVSLLYCRSQASVTGTSSIRLDAACSNHLELLETMGHIIVELNLSLAYTINADSARTRSSMMNEGGALAHLLNHCSRLETAEYKTDSLISLRPIAMTATNTSLKNLRISCRTIHQEALLELSTRAPNVKNLTIYSLMGISSDEYHDNITLDMPQNSFDCLEILAYPKFAGASPKYIAVNIASSTKPGSRHYFKLEHNKRRREHYKALPNIDPSHKKVCAQLTVRCKSIKKLKLSNELHYAGSFPWYLTIHEK